MRSFPLLCAAALCTALVVPGSAGPAAAASEELEPATAATAVTQTSGVVLVDLYAHW